MRIHSILLCVLVFAFCSVQGFGQEEGWVSPDGPAVVMNRDTGDIQQVSVLFQSEANDEDEGEGEGEEGDEDELVAPKSDIDAEGPTDIVINTEKTKDEKPVEKPKRTLSPELVKLREQITGTLAAGARRPLELYKDTPASVIAYSFAYGTDTPILQVSQTQAATGQRRPPQSQTEKLYAIGALCWNYPCGGKTLLRVNGKDIIAKVGPGLQRKPGTLLAMLAMSSVAEKYEVRAGDTVGTIVDLVLAEKAACSTDADMSLALIGLSFYCDVEEEWTNEFGEKWSIPKMVLAELLHPADQGTSNITDQLLGLACAVRRFENEGIELTGPMLDAKNYLKDFEKFAISAQNEQGLWHPRFFLFKGSTSNPWDALYSGGHIFRFLAFSLSDEKLTDPQVVRSARALTDLINKIAATPPTTERQVEALATALHAIAIYNERLGDDSTR